MFHPPGPEAPDREASLSALTKTIMREFEFIQTQSIERPLEEVFAFFSDVHNLTRITPPWIDFRVLTPDPIEMRVGTLIDFKLKLHGIPLKWRTEITAWDPPCHFTDEQRTGPYQQWIHTHSFTSENGRTQMTDHVRYAAIGGILIQKLFLERDIRRIFGYRKETLHNLFS